MSIVRGVIEASNHNAKFGTYGILVDGKWYNSKYEIRAEKGDEVEFDDGGKNYVRKCKVVGSSSSGSTAPSVAAGGVTRTPGFPVPVDTKDRSIVRQNALKIAAELITNMMVPDHFEFDTWEEREKSTKAFAELIVDAARIFEDYSSGDGDAAEAAAMLDE